MKYDEERVKEIFSRSLEEAREMLSSLSVAEGRKPDTKGLVGWVFEQTIRYCLSQELNLLGITPLIEQQKTLIGRAKVDLLAGDVAIEIKALGSFGNDAEKYKKYRKEAEKKGWKYFYLTLQETYSPYRKRMMQAFGKNRAFFLDTPDDWSRFIVELAKNFKRQII